MTEIITAAAGFLVAVLWFDLMFDVQVLAHRRSPEVPESVTESIATYYRRVTTTASPMGTLVGIVMAVLLITLVVQAVTADVAVWVSAVSIAAAAAAIGLAMARVFPRAVRLGERSQPQTEQSEIARSIFRDHVLCLAAMVILLGVQLVWA
jgi:transcriptional regulator of acetoin/glycerol metabolism